MKRILSPSFTLATLVLASACSTKNSDSLLAPSPEPSKEVATQPTKATGNASRAISSFVQFSGHWVDLGIGGTGSNERIYAIGTPSDYGTSENVYVFNNDYNYPQWTKVTGVYNAQRITVDKNGDAWITDTSYDIYRHTNNPFGGPGSGSWTKLQGQAKDIGAGGGNNGQGEVYIIGAGSGNRDIYSYNHSAGVWYTRNIGKGVGIDVDDTGSAWLLTENGEVYRGNVGGWARQSGQLKDIGATGSSAYGTTPSVYGIGYGVYNKSIYENVGGNWVKTPTGEAIRVDVDQNGRPWVINDAGDMYYSR